ncbi:hypothetical protein C8J57DRAFT_1373709 [Mycena rebaudengoi]|nr:hypothetical protein C8J57DRAFT_1373709 [Mycena rebaudengoi]
MVSFPQELVETIIDAVHTSHGKKSLRACALASKALLVASQRCLFRSISLGKSPTQERPPNCRGPLSISMMEINGVLILAHLTCLFAILPNVERLQFDAANRFILSLPLLRRWLLSVREVSFTNCNRLTLGWPNGPSLARFLLRPATITHLQQLCYVSLQVHLDGSLLGLHPLLLQCSHFILTIEHAPLWMPALEVLTLEIHPIAHHSQDVATRAWFVADEALARGLPRLHAVTIVSSVHNTEVPDAFPTFVSDVKSALPQARDAGLLTFIDELGRSDAH